MKNFIRFAYYVSQRKLIVPQIIAVQLFEDRFKVSSQTYEFLINKKPPSNQIYKHDASTPSAVLKKTAIHILPDSIPELNKKQKIAAVTRQFDEQYQDAFNKCTSPKQIFHLQRRIKYEIRNKLNFIGCLSSKYRHLLTFKSFFDIAAQKTQSQYQKNGVKVDLIESSIYPKGKVWMPTSTRYLTHFSQIVKMFSANKNVSALDIGCGSGILSFVFAKNNKKSKIYSFDKNKDAVQTTNINAASLKMNNIEAFEFDVLEQQKFQLKTLEHKLPKHFDCIFVNPPWIPASKLQGDSAIADGVYDKNSKMLVNSLKLSKRLIAKQGKIILIYSDLAQMLALNDISVENIAKELGLSIQSKYQLPLYEQMPKKSALQQFKGRAKILTYVLTHG